MTLFDLTVGESAIIKEVNGEKKLVRRLFDMGLTPGVEVYLRKKAPLGDPIELTLRGYELSIRKAEAKSISIEEEKQ